MGFPRKALSLALAALILATTLVAAPMPGWVPVVGDSAESASAHPGYWKTTGGYWNRIPNGNMLVSRCVQHDIDPATDSWVCVRTESSWEPMYVSVWVPERTFWYHRPHPDMCSTYFQAGWTTFNLGLGFVPGGQVPAAGSTGLQIATTLIVC